MEARQARQSRLRGLAPRRFQSQGAVGPVLPSQALRDWRLRASAAATPPNRAHRAGSRCARVALQRNMVEQAERLFSPAAGRLLQECLARKRSALGLASFHCTNKGQNSGGQRPDQQSPSRYRTAKRRGWRRETHPVLTPSCSRATPRTVSNPSRHGRHPPHIC